MVRCGMLKDTIRTIPDYPKPGIQFRDITTLLADGAAFTQAVAGLTSPWADARVSTVAAIEARGFIVGAAVAHALGTGFVPIRKRGKLPHTTVSASYALEYGTDTIEMHRDAVRTGERVLLIDDLIATGGTALAAVSLLRSVGAEVIGAGFVIDLPDLGGSAALRNAGIHAHSLVEFPGH
ncbi:MAG: adenine phosphoribosyltransferase [Pseudomonadota bacterium]